MGTNRQELPDWLKKGMSSSQVSDERAVAESRAKAEQESERLAGMSPIQRFQENRRIAREKEEQKRALELEELARWEQTERVAVSGLNAACLPLLQELDAALGGSGTITEAAVSSSRKKLQDYKSRLNVEVSYRWDEQRNAQNRSRKFNQIVVKLSVFADQHGTGFAELFINGEQVKVPPHAPYDTQPDWINFDHENWGAIISNALGKEISSNHFERNTLHEEVEPSQATSEKYRDWITCEACGTKYKPGPKVLKCSGCGMSPR